MIDGVPCVHRPAGGDFGAKRHRLAAEGRPARRHRARPQRRRRARVVRRAPPAAQHLRLGPLRRPDPEAEDEEFPPGSVVRLLDEALALLPDLPEVRCWSAGCAVGRTTLHLAAKTGQPALGVDLNPVFLRAAQQVFCRGRIRYDLRRNGLAYLRRDHEVILPGLDQADGWLCDATALPFADGTFGLASCLHTFSTGADPAALLRELARVVRPGGYVLASTPYDWSAAVTPPANGGEGPPTGRPRRRVPGSLGRGGAGNFGGAEDVPWTCVLTTGWGGHTRVIPAAARALASATPPPLFILESSQYRGFRGWRG